MGIVRTQAHTIWPATPHRTADSRRVAPTPTIAPVMAWVVLTGTPVCVAIRMDRAAPVSAAKPPTGCSLVIFERFYRVDKSRARDPGGSGLGLAIVKHLVELHGGRVRVENAPGAGASFTIELPAGGK